MVFASLAVFSQTTPWYVGGNTGATEMKLGGTQQGSSVSFITQDQTRMSLTATGWLGLGIINPRGTQEVNYCPPPGLGQNGLIVTLNNCGGFTANDISQPDFIGKGIEVTEGDSTLPTIAFKPPISYLTGSNTNVLNPLYGSLSPMFWVRQQSPTGFWNTSGPDEFDTKFIVMPDGSCGINIAKPRAAMDVRGSNAINYPAAIIGARALGYQNNTNLQGLTQFYTQQVQFVPRLGEKGYNPIVKNGDQGIFFTDGKGLNASLTSADKHDGSNLNGAFVLAPWGANGDTLVSGLRMDKYGNVGLGTSNTNGYKLAVDGDATINGKLICKNEFKVQEISVAWPDYVFRDYALSQIAPISIADMEEYVLANHHLPFIKSEKEILENGFSLVEDYAALLRQLEVMSLQIIELNKKVIELSK